ncbi:MAG: hypothetical protein H8E41_11335 [Desulfobulbaceae bacterium]|uniref:Uncharacterized protein n=1 Tax=Candidatus Desulfobia pelagia TaxID=2841692 RepID=A0A8J6NFR1_9BACT|nr:hypothetical protein [Candidatus Desulfobia pelagia]
MSHLLLLLAIIPLSCFNLTTTFNAKRRWMLTGITIGMVIAPVSLALIKFSYIPVIGKLIGLIGLVTNLIHGSVGYFGLMTIGIMEPGAVIAGPELLLINMVNAVVWASYYGIIGYNIDNKNTAVVANLHPLQSCNISQRKNAA